MKENKKPLTLRVLNIIFTIGFYTIPLGWILKLFFTWGGKVSIIAFIICITTLVSYLIHTSKPNQSCGFDVEIANSDARNKEESTNANAR